MLVEFFARLVISLTILAWIVALAHMAQTAMQSLFHIFRMPRKDDDDDDDE